MTTINYIFAGTQMQSAKTWQHVAVKASQKHDEKNFIFSYGKLCKLFPIFFLLISLSLSAQSAPAPV